MQRRSKKLCTKLLLLWWQLPGDFTLNYFEAENPETMKDITVEQLTKGKKVGQNTPLRLYTLLLVPAKCFLCAT
jgi:hypothetical protein